MPSLRLLQQPIQIGLPAYRQHQQSDIASHYPCSTRYDWVLFIEEAVQLGRVQLVDVARVVLAQLGLGAGGVGVPG